MLEKATEVGKYQHYHLLSGEDLPIQSQKTIQDFFMGQKDKEFVGIQQPDFRYGNRVYYRYFFQEKVGRKVNTLGKIQDKLLLLQRILGLKRNTDIAFQKGSNWFSITDELARYVLQKKDWIAKTFKYSCCADEIFLQTIVLNSKFIGNLYYSGYDDPPKRTMRLVDWKRGNPYIFRMEDIDLIKKSSAFFARKFDCDVDANVIKEVGRLYSSKPQSQC